MTNEKKAEILKTLVFFCAIMFVVSLAIPAIFRGKPDVKNGITESLSSPVTPTVPDYMEDLEDKTPAPDYRVVTMKVTAYCPCEKCCAPYADGVTSTGKSAYSLGVAVDPKFIEYGTVIEIPGYGIVEADDCGGAIKGNRLDVRFPTHQEALNWGVKNLRVKIYGRNK